MISNVASSLFLSFFFLSSTQVTGVQEQGGHFTHYAAAQPNNRLEIIDTAINKLKNWKAVRRDAFLADYAGLLFTDDGKTPYLNGVRKPYAGKPLDLAVLEDLRYSTDFESPSKRVKKEAKFIATDGKEYYWCKDVVDGIRSSDRADWWYVDGAISKYGDKITSSFSDELDTLKQNYEAKKKDRQFAQEKQMSRQRMMKNTAKKANSISKSMAKGTMEKGVRNALLACMIERVAPEDALFHSYANSKGELCFVYEELKQADCLNDALLILDDAVNDDEVCAKVLSNFDKERKALEKGERLRSLHRQAAQTQYEACEVQLESQMSDSGGELDEESYLQVTIEMIEQVHNKPCRAALCRIAVDSLTVKQLFEETVLDAWHIPQSCYDVLSKAGMLEKAYTLMAYVAEHKSVSCELATRYSNECEAQRKQLIKRDNLIQLSQKQYEAHKAQKSLKELENE